MPNEPKFVISHKEEKEEKKKYKILTTSQGFQGKWMVLRIENEDLELDGKKEGQEGTEKRERERGCPRHGETATCTYM
ncbi:Uncharacterized protein TCM_010863 [Theobroma cacao]|uniref:Uncharacterized protein n=1 Tax=Theobroma cacao TaxID=3641 RepID=A0A061E9A6_THECC|nr:Uncharacterized protein TCM_010863 [Theobroma cacao]